MALTAFIIRFLLGDQCAPDCGRRQLGSLSLMGSHALEVIKLLYKKG